MCYLSTMIKLLIGNAIVISSSWGIILLPYDYTLFLAELKSLLTITEVTCPTKYVFLYILVG